MPLLLALWLLSNPTLGDGELSRPVHTYSIVAYDATTGEVGAAVQSHWFNVGSLVIWVESGVGAVATQSFMNPDYGHFGLKGLAAGQAPADVLRGLVEKDPGKDVRQVAIVDTKGQVAGYTGAKCIQYAGDKQGQGYSVQANIMLKDTVVAAMAKGFEASAGKPLTDRLLAALQAAEAEGGDLRGKQSAALKVVKAKASDKPWRDIVADLRVEDHPDPVGELARLVSVNHGYQFMNEGDLHMEHQAIDKAMASYQKAVALLAGRDEPLFWQGLNLANVGRWAEAEPLFAEVFRKDANWRLMPDRLVTAGLITDAKIAERIKAVK